MPKVKQAPVAKAIPVLLKVLAIAAVWSIALVIGWRLRHPFVELILIAIASCVTILIWIQKGPERK